MGVKGCWENLEEEGPDVTWGIQRGFLEEVTAQLRPGDECGGRGLMGKEERCAVGRNSMCKYPYVNCRALGKQGPCGCDMMGLAVRSLDFRESHGRF